MLKVVFRILLFPAFIFYIVTIVKMVQGQKLFQAEFPTADEVRMKELRAKLWDPFLVNAVLAVFIMWHFQPIVTQAYSGLWLLINAFVGWLATSFAFMMGLYDAKVFIPLKIVTVLLLHLSWVNVPISQIGVSILTIVLGIIFFRKHRENWIIAVVAIAVGVFSLLRNMAIPGAGAIIMLVVELAGVIYFGIALLHSKKWGKVICAIIILILLYRVFNNAQNLYYLYFFRG